ncbi:MAG: hypothetical protein LC808_25510, partial [Actinobacteria bacterium]|nr:hypothetical protein [Actinomycetota bacterium]
QPPLDLLQAPALLNEPRALLSDLVEQPQHQRTRGSPPPNAICSASSRRSSTLYNYALNPRNSCKPGGPERVRLRRPLRWGRVERSLRCIPAEDP